MTHRRRSQEQSKRSIQLTLCASRPQMGKHFPLGLEELRGVHASLKIKTPALVKGSQCLWTAVTTENAGSPPCLSKP